MFRWSWEYVSTPRGNGMWCDHKFSSAQRLGAVSKASKPFDCQNQCFETEACGGWSLRLRDGECRMYTTSGEWPYKHQMKWTKGFMSGPRWDTRQGPIVKVDDPQPADTSSTNTDTSSTNTATTATTTTTTTQQTEKSFFEKHRTILIVAAILCVVAVAMSSMFMVLLAASSG